MTKDTSVMRIFVRDLKLDMSIGIYDFEKIKQQPVVINIDAGIIQPADKLTEKMDDWISYEALAHIPKAIAANGHIDLLETYAHCIADELLKDARITDIHIRIEKTEIIKDTASVGVDLHKSR